MPTAARKSADAAPAADEAQPAAAEVAAPATVAEEAPVVEAPAEEVHRPAVTVRFAGQAESSVAAVGLCAPGGEYPVPASVADQVCRGESPLFTRADAA